MSVDVLQEKIRKTKNPSVFVIEAFPALIPPQILECETDEAKALGIFIRELLTGLSGIIPAVRFGFGSFAMLGSDGLVLLGQLMAEAEKLGYYVLLDMPEMLSSMAAQSAADKLATGELYSCHGIIISTYLGSDGVKPFLELCKRGKTVFPVVRTSNKTAPEIQDLLTGTRLVHTAAADIVCRLGESMLGRCGYSQVGALAAAGAADSLRSLRAKYKRMFLLLDGYDYPNANAKNCSFAFDNLGHGAAACAGVSIMGAWKDAESDSAKYVTPAVQAAERMKKNLTRYISVL